MELPTSQPDYSDFDRQAAGDDGSISKAEEEIRSEDDKFDPFYDDDCYIEPFLYHQHTRYPNSVLSYFKRDHPDDDLFMEKLRSSHPERLEKEVESLTKQVVVELIWRDTRIMKDVWNNKEMEHLYTTLIEAAACLVYFLYPQTELYRIGRKIALDEELDELWDQLQLQFQLQQDCPFDRVCTLINQLTSTTQDKYLLVTEDVIGDMIYQPDFRYPRLKSSIYPSFPIVAEKDKDKLFNDIAKVVQDLKPPPLEPHEYTHWMMTFLRGDALNVEIYIMAKILDDRSKLPIQGHIHEYLIGLFHGLLIRAKKTLKEKLMNVVLPLITICQPVRREMSWVILEIVEVAELRRIAVGNQFIGRSHLIWAFYKLGYALPLEIRNRISFHDADENHPPYHIYLAAAKLALLSGDGYAKLVHFIFVVLHSKDIGFDGERVTEILDCFEVFKQELEEMENEIEPKHTVTVRPCRVVDAIIQEMSERYHH